MAIKDLQARQGNVNIELTISDKGNVREFEKFGKKGRVCNAKGKDDTGEITLTLWNEDIDAVGVGDKVSIENGWVSEWQNELQLGTGKFGKMTVVEKGAATAVTPDEQAEADIVSPPKDTGDMVEEELIEDLE